MRLLGIVLVPTIFGTCGLCFAGDIKPSPSTARPSMPYAGTATMHVDGSLALRLRLTSEDKEISDMLNYKTSDRGYDNVLRHLGGLRPGDTKSFRPWKD